MEGDAEELELFLFVILCFVLCGVHHCQCLMFGS